MSGGGYEYNLTTQSEFQEMKQKNQELIDQNYNLKKTLEQLIKVNNELSETIQQFNNSALAASGAFKNMRQNDSNTTKAVNHDECTKMIEGLEQQVQYFKTIAYEKMDTEDNAEIVSALEGLIQSFKEAQKYYEDQINAICEQVDNLKTQLENKVFKIQEVYYEKSRVLQEMIKQLRKKQQIVSIIEKKAAEQKRSPRKLMKKNSQIDTSSERKVASHQVRDLGDMNQKQKMEVSKQVDDLKQRQKRLNDQLRQKDKTIAAYTELLAKLRKKLIQKY